MVIAIAVGTAKVQLAGEDEWRDLAVGTGFAEIVNNRVTLLVDTAECAVPRNSRNVPRSRCGRNRAYRSITIPRRPSPGQ